ncbi:MAG: YaiO family outer membrane beta-barrel protein [Rhodospirillaceae bacterium]|nr:YaiO family outer membrane beta-barrel protein [Rhodospirillaceae bacterium]
MVAISLLCLAPVSHAHGEGAKSDANKDWQVSIVYSNSNFSRSDRKEWHEEKTVFTRRVDEKTNINLSLGAANRFATYDVSVGGGVSHNFGDGVYANASFYATPDADFLARWAMQAGGGVKLWDGPEGAMGAIGPTVATINILHKDYASGDSENIDPGFVQYFSKIPVWVSGKWINTFAKKPSKRTTGYSIKLDWQMLDNLRPFAGFAFAPESDNGVVTNVSTRFGGIIYDIEPDTSIRIDYAGEDRKGSYLRNIYSIGLSRRF